MNWLHNSAAAQGVLFKLGTIAETISWGKGKVEISAKRHADGLRDKHTGRYAIITLPLGVLQASSDGSVRFEPPLTEKGEALRKLAMGHAVRIALRFRQQWWSDYLASASPQSSQKMKRSLLGFLFSRDEVMPTWWTVDPGVPILIGWAGGAQAQRLLSLNTGILISEAVHSLARIFQTPPIEIEHQLEDAYTYDWQADPFARGSYSYALVGGAGAMERLAQPVVETLYFA